MHPSTVLPLYTMKEGNKTEKKKVVLPKKYPLSLSYKFKSILIFCDPIKKELFVCVSIFLSLMYDGRNNRDESTQPPKHRVRVLRREIGRMNSRACTFSTWNS